MKTLKKPQDSKFYEEQNQMQKWIYLIIVLVFMINIAGIIQQVILGRTFGNHPVSDLALILFLLLPTALLIFIRLNRMKTYVTDEGVWVMYKPYHRKFRFYAWEEMDSAFVRLYHPMKEFGGYGIRMAPNGKSRAFNVAGDSGLQLVFKNGKRLLIGTQKAQQLNETIAEMRKQHKIDKFPKTDLS